MSVLPIKRIIGSIKMSPMTITTAPTKIERKKLVEAYILAFSTFFEPSCCEIFAPAPCPNIKPKACRIDIKLNTIPVAPLAEVLIVPTK